MDGTTRDAFAVCEAIAEDRTRASANNAFSDGYRTAAGDIARAIGALREGRPPTPLHRDLRDAEVEARTLARVVAVAAALIDSVGDEIRPADAVRGVLLVFFDDDDLPENLRRRPPQESTPRLVTRRSSERGTGGTVGAPKAEDVRATTMDRRPRKARRRAG